jgi:Rrf2 family protein
MSIARRRKEGHQTGVQAGEIAEEFGLPEAYEAKVMSQLARSRLLRSDRGPRGGFQLVRDAKDITMLEVIESVNGTLDGRADTEQSGAPEEIQSGLIEVFGQATDATREVLQNVTIGAFVDEHVTVKAGK